MNFALILFWGSHVCKSQTKRDLLEGVWEVWQSRNPPVPPAGTELQIREIRAMLAEDRLPDAYAEAILKQMCLHPHRFPLQRASSEQLGKVIAALSYRKKRVDRRAAQKTGA